MRFILLLSLSAFLLPTCSLGVYESKEKAWENCLDWMKEAGEFYILEGESYNMVIRRFPIRSCFYDVGNNRMVGQELTQIKTGVKFRAQDFPDIGKGIATPVTKKTITFK